MIKIFIPSWRRPTTHTTPQLLLESGIKDFKVVVRKNEHKAYLQNLSAANLLVIGDNDALNIAREYTRSLCKQGEWCLQMDDNVRGFIQPETKFYRRNQSIEPGPGEAMITRARWQATMNVHVSFKQFYELIVQDTLHVAEERGAWLCGFSAHENPAFRGRKYTDVGYVCGKAMLMRNQGLSWCQSARSSGEDYALTAAHLYENGRVLINKWGHPLRVHYQPGGCGPYLERLPDMAHAQQELTARYGALFGIKNANSPKKKQGELRIRLRTVEQVAAWRAALPADPNMRARKKAGRR